MADISNEINAFKDAVYGKDVRQSIVDLAEKLNDDLEDAMAHEFVGVDDTLTKAGFGADAKATGDALAEKADISYVGWYFGENTYDLEVANSIGVGSYAPGRELGSKSVAIGTNCRALNNSLAVGNGAIAGTNSIAVGSGVEANDGQLVVGGSNAFDTNQSYRFIVGGGQATNIHTVDKNGNGWYAGNLKIGGTSYADADEVATKDYVDVAIGGAFEFDDEPTINSENPVTSNGVYNAIQSAVIGASGITIDSALSTTSENAVQNKIVANAFRGTNGVFTPAFTMGSGSDLAVRQVGNTVFLSGMISVNSGTLANVTSGHIGDLSGVTMPSPAKFIPVVSIDQGTAQSHAGYILIATNGYIAFNGVTADQAIIIDGFYLV